MDIVAGIIVILMGLILLIWFGLKIKPKPFKPYPASLKELKTVPLPDGLPAPVERYYRQIYGDQIPVITSAVISGRARMRVGPITFPARFRFLHQAGQNYRHYIEATLFGFPIMKVNEHYLDGKSRLELPFGIVENEPKVDQAANLGLWAESIWLPTIFLTDPRVHWEAVDADTTLLVVPFENLKERFVVRFDPRMGLPTFLEAMRYKGAADEVKTLWINQALAWGEIQGWSTLTVGSVVWLDEGTPWAVFTVEEIAFNADIGDYIRAKGP